MPALRAGGGSRPRPLGASRARPQFRRRALGPCPLCGSRPLSAPRAAGARGYAACGRVCHIANHPTRPRQAACGGPCLMICAVAQCNQGRCIALKQVSGDNKKTRCPMQRVFCKRQLAGPNRFFMQQKRCQPSGGKGRFSGMIRVLLQVLLSGHTVVPSAPVGINKSGHNPPR